MPSLPSSNYDKTPFVELPASAERCHVGWGQVVSTLRQALAGLPTRCQLLSIECYPGVHEAEICEAMEQLQPQRIIRSSEAFLSPEQIDALVLPHNGGADPVFGVMNRLRIEDFLDRGKIEALQQHISRIDAGLVIIIGPGASRIHSGDIRVYADLARWEAQLRMRRDEISNLGVDNKTLKWSLQYKRAYFTDWRVADRLKREVFPKADFILDTNRPGEPRVAGGSLVRKALSHACTRPFRVVPFFDPAPWGGQWMKEYCDLDRSSDNFGWCFDCVPEENSLLLKFGDTLMELPSIDVVFQEPRALLGEKVHARFGDEFPIRFDFLDTMDGGNLSFQVHPLTEYIYEHFGMSYTQDESYYYLDAAEDGAMYLALQEGVDQASMAADLRSAQRGEIRFPDEKYVNRLPAKKHDHFLIPAGTVHCGGEGGMVLEISATPYIFTFKMWDWGRLGLDGLPRPINVERGLENIAWDRDLAYAKKYLINCVEKISEGDGWREERTGLHEREFIETRRHWFTGTVPHDTAGGVNVINLVEGREAIVESPTGAFEPFVVHYAETFIVPAAVGAYTIRPYGEAVGHECATIKAFVRT
jgi:hypothetical protein